MVVRAVNVLHADDVLAGVVRRDGLQRQAGHSRRRADAGAVVFGQLATLGKRFPLRFYVSVNHQLDSEEECAASFLRKLQYLRIFLQISF